MQFVGTTKRVWCLDSEHLGLDASSALLACHLPFSEQYRVSVWSSEKMHRILYLSPVMLGRLNKIIMGDNCGLVEKIFKVR